MDSLKEANVFRPQPRPGTRETDPVEIQAGRPGCGLSCGEATEAFPRLLR